VQAYDVTITSLIVQILGPDDSYVISLAEVGITTLVSAGVPRASCRHFDEPHEIDPVFLAEKDFIPHGVDVPDLGNVIILLSGPNNFGCALRGILPDLHVTIEHVAAITSAKDQRQDDDALVLLPHARQYTPRYHWNAACDILLLDQMKRTLTVAGITVVAFIVGASVMYLLKEQRSRVWISVVSDGAGFGMSSEALNGDIPWPETTKPSGRIKFLSRDKGEEFGYMLKLPIKPNPTAALPPKYRKTKRPKGDNGLEFGAPDQVLYEGHFEFTLKDADGFVLMKLNGPVEHLSAGSENSVQGTAEEVIPNSVIQRTKQVDVTFLVTSCNPCQAD